MGLGRRGIPDRSGLVARGGFLELLDTTAIVDTPERVRFRYRLAGPGRRAVAWVIDSLVALFVILLFALVLSAFATLPALMNVGTGLLALVWFGLQWLYGVGFETAFGGRTPGKMAMSLRVVREDGSPGRFPEFFLRNLLRSADFLPVLFGLGLLVMMTDRKLRRIGDCVAGTVVVVEERGEMYGGLAIDPPVTDAERQALPPRVVLAREEVAVIESFLRRRRALSPERSEELAALYGPALAERTGVNAPTWSRVLVLAYARATGKDR